MKLPDVFEYERQMLRQQLEATTRAMQLWRGAAYVIFAILVFVAVLFAMK